MALLKLTLFVSISKHPVSFKKNSSAAHVYGYGQFNIALSISYLVHLFQINHGVCSVDCSLSRVEVQNYIILIKRFHQIQKQLNIALNYFWGRQIMGKVKIENLSAQLGEPSWIWRMLCNFIINHNCNSSTALPLLQQIFVIYRAHHAIFF